MGYGEDRHRPVTEEEEDEVQVKRCFQGQKMLR